MATLRQKQPTLKPQDLLVTLKIAVNEDREFTFAELGQELSMSASEVHSASQRAEMSRLLTRDNGQLRAVRSALQEFVVHGVKYSFPALTGSTTRGMATSTSAFPLKQFFSESDIDIAVWPDSSGTDRGMSLQPLYPSVPSAARADSRLYEVLILVDALRSGAAREREIATTELMKRLT